MKNIVIFKNEHKEADNQPDWRIKAQDGDNWVEIGALWTKEKSDGTKFLGGKLKDAYQDKAGYEIVLDAPQTSPETPLNAPESDVNVKDDDGIDF